MKRLGSFFLAALLAASAAAQVVPPPTAEALRKAYQAVPELDKNQDGAVSAQEFHAGLGDWHFTGKLLPLLGLGPTLADVPYGPYERDVLDFWQAKSDTPTPLIVYIHGGGFMARDKGNVTPEHIVRALAAGISFASISYRYSTQAIYPAPMLDGARAIQFLRSKAAEWNIDPKRLAAYGTSAGAGITMWIGFHDDLANLKSSDPVERESTRLTCLATVGGQISYDPVQIREWIGESAAQHPCLPKLFGLDSIAADQLEKPEVKKMRHDSAAINHLTADDPPIFMVYTEPNVPLPPHGRPGAGIHHPKFGLLLKEQMDALKIECVYRNNDDGLKPPPEDALIEWLMRHLQPAGKP